MADEENEELTTNEKKSKGVRERWDRRTAEKLAKSGSRSSKRYDYKCFEGLSLSPMQKEFVVVFMDPPFFGNKKNRYKAYEQVFNPSNHNSCKSNCSALMSKSKIKEAMVKYQSEALRTHKIEVTTENVEALRTRSTYLVSDFYETDGTPKPLDTIDPDKLICIDDVDVDWKLSNKTEKKIIKYKLADRYKAMDSLQKLLGIMKEMEKLEISVPTGGAVNPTDGEATNKGPGIIFNMSIGNQTK